jgi:hypothetical protein
MEERSGTLRRVVVAIGLPLALGCLLAPAALAAKNPKHPRVKDATVWLCKPGIPNNPCEPGFDSTLVSPSGQVLGTQSVKRDRKRKFDCFYVYPTVSDDKSTNSDLSIDPEERSIALYQAARYGLHCRVFAPMYRQITLQALFSGGLPADAQQIAYGDVVAAWKTYLRKYNQGRGVVLIGHSQGTYVLRELIHQLIDRQKNVRARLISAVLLGGNVTVREGSNVGGDFKNIPGCRKVKEAGCAIAFSTFAAPVPSDSRFGRPGTTVIAPGLATTGDVLCTNPAALRGGTALLTSVFPTAPFAPGTTIGAATQAVGQPTPTGATTPWFQVQGYVGACDSSSDADVLQISPVDGAPTLRPVPDATWGLHLVDANIALGNLTDDVARQAKFWLRANGNPKKKRR